MDMDKVEFVRVVSELLSKVDGQESVDDYLVEKVTEIAEFKRALEYEDYLLIRYGFTSLSEYNGLEKTYKPIVYKYAKEEGMSPEDMVDGMYLNFQDAFVYPFENKNWKALEIEYTSLESFANFKLSQLL